MTDQHDYVIETRALSKRYGRKLALDNLDVRIPRGRIHAIVGANGAGKSTLFRILMGFMPQHPERRASSAATARRSRLRTARASASSTT